MISPPPTRLPRLLTINDVALQLLLSIKNSRRMIQRGELRAHQIGRQLRVPEHEVAALLNKGSS